jgi:hypothetical protein
LLLEQDLEKQLAKVRKFIHLSCLVAMIVEIQHSAKASSTPIVMIDLVPQFENLVIWLEQDLNFGHEKIGEVIRRFRRMRYLDISSPRSFFGFI